MTPSEIEPATFRFVAQCLNQLPHHYITYYITSTFVINGIETMYRRYYRRRWVDNIRMDLQEVGCGYMDWIGLAQDRDRWRTLVSAVMNLRVP